MQWRNFQGVEENTLLWEEFLDVYFLFQTYVFRMPELSSIVFYPTLQTLHKEKKNKMGLVFPNNTKC